MMAKIGYVKIARVLSGLTRSGTSVEWTGLVDDLSRMLAADNPRFDRERFLRACLGDRQVSAREFDQRLSTQAAMIRDMRGDPE